MGTDIHMIVEKRGPRGWERVEESMGCWRCDKGSGPRHDDECYYCDGTGRAPLAFRERSYDTFAVLANVRNGTGFAGCVTSEKFTPISDPRGLPSDRTALKRKWELGDHSFSWVTLGELLSYDWDRRVVQYGVVSENEFKEWDGKGWPKRYSGDVFGCGVVKVTNDEMREIIAGTRPRLPDSNYYTQIQWSDTVAKCCENFHDKFIPLLCELGAPEDVRLVFGFDS